MDIEQIFTDHKKDMENIDKRNSLGGRLAQATENLFLGDYKFNVTIVSRESDRKAFCMCVYPSVTTTDKIIEAIMNDEDGKEIQRLWDKNKEWNIEVDEMILNDPLYKFNLTGRELTAIYLHELGHIISSNSIPTRISTVLRYEIYSARYNVKAQLHNRVFRTIMSLPIFDACISDNKSYQAGLKEEIKADKFAKKHGYAKDLISAFDKLMKNPEYPTGGGINDKMKKTAEFALQNVADFQARKQELAKRSLFHLKESCDSPFLKEVLTNYYETVFEGQMGYINKIDYMTEKADSATEEYVQEFFIWKGKKLKRIDPNDLSYIDIKINMIKTETDRMMIVSYIHSKLDMVEYYLDIMDNKSIRWKYDIPQSRESLEIIRKRLIQSLDRAMNFKIPMNKSGFIISWPTGYEG